MANIKLVPEREASGRVKEIYEDIKATMEWSFVPETFQLIAHNPEHLESYWAHYKQAMGPGRLDLDAHLFSWQPSPMGRREYMIAVGCRSTICFSHKEVDRLPGLGNE